MRHMKRMGVMKVGNEYAGVLGKFYEDTPKAVFAALAYSYAACFGTPGNGEDATENPAEVIARLREEWAALHANNIVPQRPPTRFMTAMRIAETEHADATDINPKGNPPPCDK